MKFIEKLQTDLANGKFEHGLIAKPRFSANGIRWTYCIPNPNHGINAPEMFFYESFRQTSNAHKIFRDFLNENNIKITKM